MNLAILSLPPSSSTAYRNKLERYDEKYHEEFGRHMVNKYREKARQQFPNMEFPTVSISQKKRKLEQKNTRTKNKIKLRRSRSFSMS